CQGVAIGQGPVEVLLSGWSVLEGDREDGEPDGEAYREGVGVRQRGPGVHGLPERANEFLETRKYAAAAPSLGQCVHDAAFEPDRGLDGIRSFQGRIYLGELIEHSLQVWLLSQQVLQSTAVFGGVFAVQLAMYEIKRVRIHRSHLPSKCP